MIVERHQTVQATGIDSKIEWDRDSCQPGWQPHTLVQMDGEQQKHSASSFQLLSAQWGHENAQMPSMVAMPEKQRLLLIAQYGPPPVCTIATYSDDNGATWSKKELLQSDNSNPLNIGMAVGLTYLGDGVVTFGQELSADNKPKRWFSTDFGQTWTQSYPVPLSKRGTPLYYWNPMLIDRDEDGSIIRLLEARWGRTNRAWDAGTGAYSQATLWQSEDIGHTWSAETEVPQWRGVNEVSLIRARNGDIVAACRTDNPERFIGQLDLYSGLGISLSKDNGVTWSDLNILYEFGRHHPSLVMMENGDLLMTYAVRQGYFDTPEGFPQFGIEAVISTDNGQTWNLDQRTILATWRGKIHGDNAWWGLAQSTSTQLLPDGSLLTAFGTGVRNQQSQERCIMDLGLVLWRID